jgi:hypothetical protein
MTLNPISVTADGRYLVVRGRLPHAPDAGSATYVAAAPAEHRSSFSGSAMPFASASQAFYNTPNRGELRVGSDSEFTVRVLPPNAYYVGLGTSRVPPVLHVSYIVDGEHTATAFKIADGVPFRSLTYPASRTSCAAFYGAESPFVRSQEEILRASGYPDAHNAEPADFWGGKPAR